MSLYKLFNCIFYFTPILLANDRWRHKFLIPFYKGKAGGGRSDKHERAVVFMALNETTFSGGLSDRLRGIVSVYAECKRQGRPFRIVFEPLHLEDYLAPNVYDWRIGRMRLTGIWRRVIPAFFLPIITTRTTVGSISCSRRYCVRTSVNIVISFMSLPI